MGLGDHAGEEELLVYRLPGAANHDVVPVLKPLSKEFVRSFCPEESRPGLLDGTAVIGRETVRVARLDTWLEESGFDHLDVLSVDVDGTEFDVLRGCDLNRWKPRVVVVENPFSDIEMGKLLVRASYRPVRRIENINEVWLRGDA